MNKTRWMTLVFLLFFCNAISQAGISEYSHPPALNAITLNDLETDLYQMAGDHFKGREAGTLNELQAAVWWAKKLAEAGLQPQGDDGTYFQFFNMIRNRISMASTIQIGGKNRLLWKDVLVLQTAPVHLNAPIVFAGSASKKELDALDLKGKVVAIKMSKDGINLDVSLPERRYPGYITRKYSKEVLDRGAVGIIFITDVQGDVSWPAVVPALSRGLYDIEGGANAPASAKLPIFWIHNSDIDLVRQPGMEIRADISIETFSYPSVNIIGSIEGTDPQLKNEYVLYSGHIDHDGVR